ncbi:MAG: PP2C family protein-serine/threonine phosphatase [Acidimicrobiales bacterium]
MDHVSALEVASVRPFGRIARLLAATHDVQGVLDEIVRLAVVHLDACDFAGISFVDGRRITSPAASSEAAALVDAIQAEMDQGPCLDAIKHHEVFQTGDLSAEDRWPKFAARAHAETCVRSILSLRLFLEADTYGSLNLYSTVADAFDASDVALGEVFASHAAVAMQSARSSTEVVALQRSMLPDVLPEVSGVSLAARYHPASIGSNVGGDWYDAYRLPDGRLVVTLGDVAGHGLAAASVMGQIRNALRAYTVEHPAPAEAVGLVSELLSFIEPGTMATLCHLIVDTVDGDGDGDDTADGDGATLRWAGAGHPPLLRVGSAADVHFLVGDVGPPVGMGLPAAFAENTATVTPGQIIVLYSDGLVERRGESIDVGLQRLADAAATAPTDLEAFCDHIIDELVSSSHDDDVAVLVLRVDRP